MLRHHARANLAIVKAVSAVADALSAYYGQGIFGASCRDTLPSPFDGTEALKMLSNQTPGFVLRAIFECDG